MSDRAKIDPSDPLARFSGRVDDYVKTRPSYPHSVLTVLGEACALGPRFVVADLGSGTGLFTRLLLESGASVHAVEPNADMRAAADAMLGGTPGYHSIAGRAEATTLADNSVDIVTAAQAFHWFDVDRSRTEIGRILRPKDDDRANAPSNVALVWNDRDTSSTPFLREYEDLLARRCPQYRELQGKADSVAKFDELLGAGRWTRRVIPNEHRHDREGLVGRLLSSSYAPKPDDAHHDETVAELRTIFDRYADGGTVTMIYTTVMILGRLDR